jgi:2-polyprenyl-3-methyl-5-hydroxy-6-metoxy-1,4-benzoquinol methylase
MDRAVHDIHIPSTEEFVSMSSHAQEIEQAQRFEFGGNWTRFLRLVNDERIAHAQEALSAMLGTKSLQGKSFLDVGSGSGLSSLSAARLGVGRIHSFDFDPQSVGGIALSTSLVYLASCIMVF